MMRRKYYASDELFPFVETFSDRNLGSVEKCDRTLMNVLYTEIVSEVLFIHRDETYVESDLVGLLSKN